ncbi:efflux RND transporter periplasmic adaptor subunit [Jannaschia rubra]|uniref:efflux RND transporter periplasmic adaptor subunit n=1 Tax=Jannaschia rubra TaxID=282197 RepID=UPI002490FBD1|nr:efflux RND transporter periplasmic adaptor subunit [Jannaschia rubra]
MKRCRPLTALFALVVALTAVPALTQQPGGEQPPPAVTVVTMEPETVTRTVTLPGRVVASASAEVRPQVAGIITERLFREGAAVEAGEPLYRIDPASYDAAVAVAQAAVAQAQAELNAANKEADRVDELQSRNVASESAADEADARRAAAEANLQAAEAQLDSARIEQDRTTIRARLSGEIGLSLTSPGALVTASQADPLAVIRAIDPVYVDVTQSAADLLAWRRNNIASRPGDFDPTVTLTLADGSIFDQTGTLTAAEPSVDQQTGVVVLRMEFDNPDKLLLPGMYVQVEMPTETIEGAFLVPQEAVSRDRRGQATALVVQPDGTVDERILTVVQARMADWIVTEGLETGDRVIVEGLQKVAPGAVATPEERAPAAGAIVPTEAVPAEDATATE